MVINVLTVQEEVPHGQPRIIVLPHNHKWRQHGDTQRDPANTTPQTHFATKRFALGAVFVYQLALLYGSENALDLRKGLESLLRAA